jgi:hypothetical protein
MIRDESAKWSCAISIIRAEGAQNKPLALKQTIPFGNILHNSGDVETMLRKAQLAALNPHCPIEDFTDFDLKAYDKKGKDGKAPPPVTPEQLAFTKNVVALKIVGPEVLNLTFIDLPGMRFRGLVMLSFPKA